MQQKYRHSDMEKSTQSGKLLISGFLSPWELNTGKGQYIPVEERSMLTEFHRFTADEYRYVTSSEHSKHSILINSKGRTLSMGVNKQFECGQANPSEIYATPTIIRELSQKNVIQAACGRHHTLFLSEKGQVYACGDNSKGQCGLGPNKKSVEFPQLIKYDGPKIIKIDCGAVILDVDGNMCAFGLSEFGQLGNNADGKYFITPTKLSFHFETTPAKIIYFTQEEQRGKMTQMQHVHIKDIACGKLHTIAVDSMGRVFTWGFGGNGQLGHNDNKDEFRPRLIKYLTATKNVAMKIYAGPKCSVVLTPSGAFFMFGQYNSKNIMYPQQLNGLIGYNINMVACSTLFLATTETHQMIVWGSHANGELGIGNNPRSSSLPMENVDVKDMKIIHMSLGKSHSMLLVDTECKVTKKKYSKFPEYKAS